MMNYDRISNTFSVLPPQFSFSSEQTIPLRLRQLTHSVAANRHLSIDLENYFAFDLQHLFVGCLRCIMTSIVNQHSVSIRKYRSHRIFLHQWPQCHTQSGHGSKMICITNENRCRRILEASFFTRSQNDVGRFRVHTKLENQTSIDFDWEWRNWPE